MHVAPSLAAPTALPACSSKPRPSLFNFSPHRDALQCLSHPEYTLYADLFLLI